MWLWNNWLFRADTLWPHFVTVKAFQCRLILYAPRYISSSSNVTPHPSVGLWGHGAITLMVGLRVRVGGSPLKKCIGIMSYEYLLHTGDLDILCKVEGRCEFMIVWLYILWFWPSQVDSISLSNGCFWNQLGKLPIIYNLIVKFITRLTPWEHMW